MLKGLPITLEAGRSQWGFRDKLARLVDLALQIGYYTDSEEPAIAGERAELRALFEELAERLVEAEVTAA